MPKPKKHHFSMLRTYTLSDLFTLLNAGCGTIAIFLCLNYVTENEKRFLWIAFFLLPVALICDILDGYVARRGRRQSSIGADLDSLADIISFGVAPAVIGFTLGMRGIWDMLILTCFVMCGISRLARFNVTAAALSDSSGKVKYFEGMPIPGNIMIVMILGNWWIRWFDFPRLQILVIGLMLIGLQLLWGVQMSRPRVLLFSALLLSVGYQAYRIFPYTPLSGVQVKSKPGATNGLVVRLITANVLMHNREAQPYLQVLADADPDIILTTEADQWWTNQLEALDHSHPYHVKYPLENTYGMILHSRFPLIEPSVQFLVEPRVPSIHTRIRMPDGQMVHFIGLHPRPPGPSENKETTERDAELIIAGNAAERSNLPVLILGDLNDVAWSHTTTLFQKISGLLDPRIGRGMFNTYHADYFFLRFPLDHIFHSAHFKLIDLRRLPDIGSDHFPMYAALSFTPRKDAAQQPELLEPEERKEVEEMLGKAVEKKP
jgi:CDP-diacylglycerol--serine O-phosphatidyltransferase